MMRNRFKNEKYNGEVKVPHNFSTAIKKEDGNQVTATLTIYGDIGDYWWDSTSAADVERELKNITADNITVRLNSPGGSAFDGIAIYNLLKSHPAKITVQIDGWACSAASVIAMAADVLIMGVGTMLMVHEAATFMYGTKAELIKESDVLAKLDESILNIYMTRFKGTREEIQTLVNLETWFTVDEAVAVGFADEENAEPTPEPLPTNLNPEEYKNSILARFQKEPAPLEPEAFKNNILDRFKRTQQ